MALINDGERMQLMSLAIGGVGLMADIILWPELPVSLAILGLLLGGLIGRYIDKQKALEKRLEELENRKKDQIF